MKLARQPRIILAAMLEGEVMNNHVALHKYGVKSLGSIISVLRKRGYKFEKGYIPWGNRRILTQFELVGVE